MTTGMQRRELLVLVVQSCAGSTHGVATPGMSIGYLLESMDSKSTVATAAVPATHRYMDSGAK